MDLYDLVNINSLKIGDFNISPYYFLKRKTEISLNRDNFLCYLSLCHFRFLHLFLQLF